MTPQYVRQIFLEERAVFASTYPKLTKAGLGLRIWRRQSDRDYAQAVPDENMVWFHGRAFEELNEDQVRGLVRHELAHLADPNLSELATDKLAEKVTGELIFYDRFDVQNCCVGVSPRPKRLHK